MDGAFIRRSAGELILGYEVRARIKLVLCHFFAITYAAQCSAASFLADASRQN